MTDSLTLIIYTAISVVCPWPLMSQDSITLPDYTALPSVDMGDLRGNAGVIVKTAICHLPDENGGSPLDREATLVILNDSVAVEMSNSVSCTMDMDLSLIERMELIDGAVASIMYGPRAGAGVLRVYSRVIPDWSTFSRVRLQRRYAPEFKARMVKVIRASHSPECLATPVTVKAQGHEEAA